MATYYPINLIPVLKGSDTYSLIITTTKLRPPRQKEHDTGSCNDSYETSASRAHCSLNDSYEANASFANVA